MRNGKGSDMLVEKIFPLARKKLATLQHHVPLIEAAKLLARNAAHLVAICDDDGVLVGVIANADIVREVCGCRGFSCTAAVSSAMTREIVSCRSQDFLMDVWSSMKRHGLTCIPVIDADSRPIGLAIARDVLRLLMEEVEHEEQLLRDYVMCVGYH